MHETLEHNSQRPSTEGEAEQVDEDGNVAQTTRSGNYNFDAVEEGSCACGARAGAPRRLGCKRRLRLLPQPALTLH